jgi:hypothetical protein
MNLFHYVYPQQQSAWILMTTLSSIKNEKKSKEGLFSLKNINIFS